MARRRTGKSVDAEAVLETLKGALRARGITYAAAARALRVSLPTMKRWMNRPDLSLDTVVRLSALAGLGLAELTELAEGQRPVVHYFDDAQDRLFFDEPGALTVLSAFVDGATISEVARRHRVTRGSVERYLLRLGEVGLVERLDTERVQVTIGRPFGFARGSRCAARDVRAATEALVGRVLAKLDGRSGTLFVKPMMLSPELHASLRQELVDVVSRYARTEELERLRAPASVRRPVTALVVVDEWAPPAPVVRELPARTRARRSSP
jgi:transposase